MVPLKSLPLEHHCDDDSEHGEGDDLLDDLELHDVERSAVAVEADSVGRDLGAVFEESQAPGQEDYQYERPAV